MVLPILENIRSPDVFRPFTKIFDGLQARIIVIPKNIHIYIFTYTYTRKNILLYAGWLVNLPRYQEARPDHVRVKSSCCCFTRELVSFVRPRELMSFDSRHVTWLLQSENVFQLGGGGMTKILSFWYR